MAIVPRAKLVDYLLSTTHPVGRHKARVMRALGFDETNADELERELLNIARSGDAEEVQATLHGMRYVIDGTIRTPRGRNARLRTVWIIETGTGRPRLVTVYPSPVREAT